LLDFGSVFFAGEKCFIDTDIDCWRAAFFIAGISAICIVVAKLFKGNALPGRTLKMRVHTSAVARETVSDATQRVMQLVEGAKVGA
jgi:hypothetical protein